MTIFLTAPAVPEYVVLLPEVLTLLRSSYGRLVRCDIPAPRSSSSRL